jgi:hypothetical protein
MASVNLKLITYRGGLVKFYAPNTWVEEYEPNGGGTFYENLPNSGTLRLNVLTFEDKSENNNRTASGFLANSDFAKLGVITPLPDGNAMLTYQKDTVEETENLRIYFWQITNYVSNKLVRVAVFSYTILAGQESDSPIANELEIIREQIPKATFAIEPGE